MKSPCSNKCIRAYVLLKDTSLVSVIKDFAENIEKIETNPLMIQQFYEYIKLKYKIPCETGMLFIEKITMLNIFEKFKIKFDYMNSLVNKKMILYQWIKSEHLEIKEIPLCQLNIITSIFKKMACSEVPSVKIYYLMKGINVLYDKIGRSVGHDILFPNLIYILILSGIKDLYAHTLLIKFFRRNYEKPCEFGCNHGFQVPICCDCLISENWNSEVEYYIITLLAAVDYIAKIEFYNLKIGINEFDNEIIKRMENIDLKDTINKSIKENEPDITF